MKRRPAGGEGHTRTQILDIAEGLVQSRGFNNFSYADIATSLSLSKPALHYHFPGKAELGLALVQRYDQRFFEALSSVDGKDALARLEFFASQYVSVLREQRMCLCGMLAAEFNTLSVPMKESVVDFFDRTAAWLSEVLAQGKSEGAFAVDGPLSTRAFVIVSSLEGAMLVARLYDDINILQTTVTHLLDGLAGSSLDVAPKSAV
ncbi:TetR/AcrR family transcriptional regulator [Nocardia sp. CDC160]|uniref:TetR/AcrR family transcriptional regulator n=1 Tax=Nocardia sp. CDC160 TaxID=3112166 RepID=UPI002DBA4F78|nr:TetR/AcrR family transcriptional regulator [Nocardia sp. CDC160]MEC3920331.1 TetR/AcrR family transcriptional regulator [Nocardia sp. CDC160]